MVKGILLGNGINNRIGIDSLSTMDIKNRFQKNMIRYAPMFVSLFNVEISNEKSGLKCYNNIYFWYFTFDAGYVKMLTSL